MKVEVIGTVTIDDIMRRKLGKPYTRARTTELFAGRERITAVEILDLDIPAADRLRAVLHESIVPLVLLHTFACDEAELALARYWKSDDRRPHEAIACKRRWLRGEATDEELAAATAACRAAWVAAKAAATWDDAGDAAWDAVWAVAWAAAAWDAAGHDAGDAQVSRLRDLLEKNQSKGATNES